VRVRPKTSAAKLIAFGVPFALAALALSASALTVSIGSPTAGTWTASPTTTIAGVASAPTTDRRVLDLSGDLAGGTEINVSNANDRVSLDIPVSETYRYTQNFTGLDLSPTIDGHWMGDLNGSFWQVTSLGSLSASPPSLGHSGTATEHVYWVTLLPGALLDGYVAFNFLCQANAAIDVWASSGGSPGNRTSILSSTGTASSAFYYNLTSILPGTKAVYLHIQVGASSSTNSFCALDDFEFVGVVDTSSASTTSSFSDDFTSGANAVWNGYEGFWAVGSPSGVSDTPPALHHLGQPSTSVRANWASASPILGATLTFDYQCQANGAIQAYISQDGQSETRVLNSARGAAHTAFSYNATALLRGGTAAYLRFASDATGSPSESCGVDDVVWSWNVTGYLSPSYTGSYTSPVIDLGAAGTLTTADWVAVTPAASAVAVSFRSSSNNVSYSPWVPLPSSGSSVATTGVRYGQFRVDFSSTANRAIPYVDRLGLNFSAIVRVEVSVNGGAWSPATGTSAWNATVALAGGSNNITARVTDSTGATAQSVVEVFRDTFPPSAPPAPTGPSVTNLTSVTWTWGPATDVGLGVDHYLVDVGLFPGGFELGAGLLAPSTTFTMTGLPDQVTAYATVWAVDAAGLTSLLASTSAGTLIDRTAPGAPSLSPQPAFTAAGALTWAWSAPAEAGSGVASYLVRVGSTPGGAEYETVSLTARNHTYSAGVSGSSYYLSVAALDLAGNLGAFATAPAVTVDQAPPTSPAPVTGPGAVTNSTALTWSWADSTDALSGVLHYFVTIGTTPGGSEVSAVAWPSTTYTAASVVPGARYYFEVRAVDGAGNAGPAGIATATLVDVEAPSAPAVDAVAAFVAASALTLTWNASIDAPSDNASGIDHYLVRTSDGTTTADTTVTGLDASVPLSDGTHYTVLVAAVDLAGNVGPSSSVSFTSDRSGPSPPTGLRLAVSSPDGPVFQASWNGTADNGSGVKEYRISIGTTPGGTDIANGRIVSTGTSEKWSGSFGTTYFVTLWAVDNLGNAGPSASLTEGIKAERPTAGGGGFLPGFEVAAALAAVGAAAILATRRRRD
jgi:hypothetical protein